MTAAKSTSSSSSQQSSASSSGTSNKPNAKQDEIVKGFHKLRQEQHVLSEKTSDLKSRISEHKSVIAALEKVSTLFLLLFSFSTYCSHDYSRDSKYCNRVFDYVP